MPVATPDITFSAIRTIPAATTAISNVQGNMV